MNLEHKVDEGIFIRKNPLCYEKGLIMKCNDGNTKGLSWIDYENALNENDITVDRLKIRVRSF